MKTLRTLAASAAIWGLAAEPALGQDVCAAPEASVRLDHVPIAVADLEDATEQLTAGFGFRTKPGRLHANGLENRHIRFEDGTALELMTVREPGDELARHYASLIADGGGGAFVSFSGLTVDSVLALAASAEPDLVATRGPAFDWAAFPPGHPLRAVFFVDVHQRAADLPAQLAHPNGARGLRQVWVAVEEPDRLIAFLERFGARDCGVAAHPFHLSGRAMGLDGGTLFVADAALWEADPESAPVLSITVAGTEPGPARTMVLRDAGGLWLEVRPPQKPKESR